MAHEVSTPRTADGAQPVPRLLRLLGTSRFLVLIAIICTFVAASVLLLYGAFETYEMVVLLLTKADESKTAKALILAAIELVDTFLLGTVLYVIAIGLYELFIDPRVPLPAWL